MERQYIRTHPWIKFRIDLRDASPRFWINAGEAKSKCEHIAGVPLKPAVAEILHRVFVAKGIHGTTAIEGNTLTEDQVRRHLEGGLEVNASQEHLIREVDNIANACNQIRSSLLGGEDYPLTPETLKRFNALILKDLPLDEEVIPGRVRTHNVGVRSYLAPAAEDCEHLLSELCKWMESETFQPSAEADQFVFAIVKAIVFHIYLAWIHPFGDGNGRTARLVEFAILLSAGISTPAAHLLSNHYNITRKRYYTELERASKSGGNIMPFIEYAMEGFVDGLRDQLELIRIQQWDVAWTVYVHEKFSENTTTSGRRQCRLALDLTPQREPVALNKIQELTPRLAKAYANKTIRTVQRDVRDLERLGLAVRGSLGVIAERGAILAFLPQRKRKKEKSPQLTLALQTDNMPKNNAS